MCEPYDDHRKQCLHSNVDRIHINSLQRELTFDTPRLSYRKSFGGYRSIVHWGQRKLLLSEIEFLTRFGQEEICCIYAGAAPGMHITILSEMFPLVHFILIDPRPFSVQKSDRIEIIQDFMTNEIAKCYKSRKCVFISDIRSADYRTMDFDQLEECVQQDMNDQMTWHNLLNSKASLLKFRLPWNRGNSMFLNGTLFLPVWGPSSTTEGRLMVVSDSSSPKHISYDHENYQDQMFYFNRYVRCCYYYSDYDDYLAQYGLDHCYDCHSEILILKNYLISKYSLVNDLGKLDKIATSASYCMYQIGSLSKRLSAVLGGNKRLRNLSDWKPMGSHPICYFNKTKKLVYSTSRETSELEKIGDGVSIPKQQQPSSNLLDVYPWMKIDLLEEWDSILRYFSTSEHMSQNENMGNKTSLLSIAQLESLLIHQNGLSEFKNKFPCLFDSKTVYYWTPSNLACESKSFQSMVSATWRSVPLNLDDISGIDRDNPGHWGGCVIQAGSLLECILLKYLELEITQVFSNKTSLSESCSIETTEKIETCKQQASMATMEIPKKTVIWNHGEVEQSFDEERNRRQEYNLWKSQLVGNCLSWIDPNWNNRLTGDSSVEWQPVILLYTPCHSCYCMGFNSIDDSAIEDQNYVDSELMEAIHIERLYVEADVQDNLWVLAWLNNCDPCRKKICNEYFFTQQERRSHWKEHLAVDLCQLMDNFPKKIELQLQGIAHIF